MESLDRAISTLNDLYALHTNPESQMNVTHSLASVLYKKGRYEEARVKAKNVYDCRVGNILNSRAAQEIGLLFGDILCSLDQDYEAQILFRTHWEKMEFKKVSGAVSFELIKSK
jgi:hypothetical protein